MQKSEGKLGHGRKGLRIKPGVTPECNSFHSSMSWRLEDYHKVMSEGITVAAARLSRGLLVGQ